MAASQERNLFSKVRFRFNWIDTRSRKRLLFLVRHALIGTNLLFSFHVLFFSFSFFLVCLFWTIRHSKTGIGKIAQTCGIGHTSTRHVRSCTREKLRDTEEIRHETRPRLEERRVKSNKNSPLIRFSYLKYMMRRTLSTQLHATTIDRNFCKNSVRWQNEKKRTESKSNLNRSNSKRVHIKCPNEN